MISAITQVRQIYISHLLELQQRVIAQADNHQREASGLKEKIKTQLAEINRKPKEERAVVPARVVNAPALKPEATAMLVLPLYTLSSIFNTHQGLG